MSHYSHEHHCNHGHEHGHDFGVGALKPDHPHADAHPHDHVPARTWSQDCDWAHLHFEGHEHDQASVITVTVKLLAGQEVPFSKLVAVAQQAARDVEAAGGIVGHIKGFAREGDTYAHVSITDSALPATESGDVAASFTEHAEIQFVLIAMLVTLNDLRGVIEDQTL